MRVAVTGGSGKLGRAVVDELLAHEYEVVNLDLVPSADPRAAFTRVDFTDFGQTLQALTAIDGRYEGVSGKYFDGLRAVRSSVDSYDRDMAADLWQTSEQLLASA